MPGMNRGDNLEEIYAWMDEIHFSKPIKNISRDFSDGVLMAELLKIHYPRFSDVHNYIPANNVAGKKENWNTLNRKIFTKIDIKLGKDVIDHLANAQPGMIEKVLIDLRNKIMTKDKGSKEQEESNSMEIYSDEDSEKIIHRKEENEKSAMDTEDIPKNGNIDSPETLSTLTADPSKSLVADTESSKNLIGRACGWLVGWVWPFNGSQKITENKLQSLESLGEISGEEKLKPHTNSTGLKDEEKDNEVEGASRISHLDILRLRQEVGEKNLAISILNRKVSCLESAMKLKDKKIGNLTAQISTTSSSSTAESTTQNLRPHVIGSNISRLRYNNTKNNYN